MKPSKHDAAQLTRIAVAKAASQARIKSQTAEQRSASASHAAKARWRKWREQKSK